MQTRPLPLILDLEPRRGLKFRTGRFASFASRQIGFACLLLVGSLSARTVTVADLQAQFAQAAHLTVIDVRSPELFAQSHIPGAINIPASLCPYKRLPPLGSVVVYGDGLGRDPSAAAAAALAAKPGITVDILEGGFAAWQSARGLGTQGRGLKSEALNYVSYAELKAAPVKDVVLVDLRKPAAPTPALAGQSPAVTPQPLTDLAQEFPGMAQGQLGGLRANVVAPVGLSTPSLLVLIDNGDGVAETIARRLKASGTRRYAILAGGEQVLARHGQPGLQRTGSRATLPSSAPAPAGTQ